MVTAAKRRAFMNKRLIFLDIDGTIASYKSPPSPLTCGAVEQLARDGHSVFLCTGRVLCDIPPVLRALPISGVIGAAGGQILVGDVVLGETVVPKPLVRDLARLSSEMGYLLVFEGVQGVYYLASSQKIPNRDYTPIADMEEFHSVADELDVCKLAYFHSQPVERRYLDYVEERFAHIPHRPGFGELLSRGVNKAVAIRRVVDHCGGAIERTLAVGDSLNDLEMLQCVGTAIAMGDSPRVVKAAADYVTGTMQEDGVYHALRHFGLVD